MVSLPYVKKLLNKCNSIADGSWISTSLCPTLGKMHVEQHAGACPHHLQSPYGKMLNISFIGVPPHVNYNPIGGSEFLVTELLSKKFGFIPNFIPAKSWDAFSDNHTTYGMVHQVRVAHRLLTCMLGGNIYG